MAKATETRTERVITLELSEEEAAFVFHVVASRVIGTSDGPRRHSDAIYRALRDFHLNTRPVEATVKRGSGNLLDFGPYDGEAQK